MVLQNLNLNLLLFNTLFVSVFSTISWGSCPRVFHNLDSIISLKTPGFLYSHSQFSATDYLGTWLDIYRNIDFSYAKGNCTQTHYYISADGKVTALVSEIVDQVNSSARAEIFISPSIDGQLHVKFSHFAPAGDYKVVHTDYKSSALVFSCTSAFLVHWKYAWILVRNLSVVVPSFYYKLIEEYGIPLEKMQRTIHQNCGALS